MGDLRTVLRDAVPSAPVPDVATLWAIGRRARRRRQAALTLGPGVVVVAVLGMMALAGYGETQRPMTAAPATASGSGGEIATSPLAASTSVRAVPIESVSVSGGMTVTLEPGSGIEIAATDRSTLEDVEVEVAGATVTIRRSSPDERSRNHVSVVIGTGALRQVDAANGIALRLDVDTNRAIDLALTGGSNVTGTIRASLLHATLGGGARMVVDGAVETLRLVGSGGVSADLVSLSVARLDVDLSNGTFAEVSVSEQITSAVLSSGSRLAYHGDPAILGRDVDTSSVLTDA